MSGFDGNTILTKRGKNYLARAQTGELLRITEVSMGNGVLNTPIEDVIAPVNPVISIDHVSLAALDNQYYIEVDYTDAPIPYDFYFREVAVFADMGEGTEKVLYSYGYSGDAAVLVTKENGGADLRKFRLIVTIDSAPNVTVVIDNSIAYVPIHDKATLVDVKDGTPNKWVASDILKESLLEIGGYPIISAFSIPVEDWDNDITHPTNPELVYHADIGNSEITPAHIGMILFDELSIPIANNAGITSANETTTGILRIWAEEVPANKLTGEFYLLVRGRKVPTTLSPTAGVAIAGTDIYRQDGLRF